MSQRIARGAIPLGDALPIAKQIADALEYRSAGRFTGSTRGIRGRFISRSGYTSAPSPRRSGARPNLPQITNDYKSRGHCVARLA